MLILAILDSLHMIKSDIAAGITSTSDLHDSKYIFSFDFDVFSSKNISIYYYYYFKNIPRNMKAYIL